jgi:Putative Actinobacterial Holin-X, holin superfamily III
MVSAPVGHDQCVSDQPQDAGGASPQLLGELARELSVLVRRDLEVAVVERLATVRRALLDVAAVGVLAVAVLFSLASLSLAAGLAVAASLAAWQAALIIAAGWAALALIGGAILLRPRLQPDEREELYGLLQMLSKNHHLDDLRREREGARDDAEREMRQSSAALVTTLLDEATEHQVKALPGVAKREAERLETEAAELLEQRLPLLVAPARVGRKALGFSARTLGRRSRDQP